MERRRSGFARPPLRRDPSTQDQPARGEQHRIFAGDARPRDTLEQSRSATSRLLIVPESTMRTRSRSCGARHAPATDERRARGPGVAAAPTPRRRRRARCRPRLCAAAERRRERRAAGARSDCARPPIFTTRVTPAAPASRRDQASGWRSASPDRQRPSSGCRSPTTPAASAYGRAHRASR